MTPDCRLCLVLSLLWEVYSSMFSGFSPFFKNQQLFPKLVILSYLLVFSPYRWHQKEKEPLMEDGQAAVRWEFRLDSEVISSSTSEQSNKRTGSRLKTESVRLLRYSYIRYAKPILRKKKPTILQSLIDGLLGIVFMKEQESLRAYFRSPITHYCI